MDVDVNMGVVSDRGWLCVFGDFIFQARYSSMFSSMVFIVCENVEIIKCERERFASDAVCHGISK